MWQILTHCTYVTEKEGNTHLVCSETQAAAETFFKCTFGCYSVFPLSILSYCTSNM